MPNLPTITPFLWFENQAVEAANFYCGIFPDSKIISTFMGPDGGVLVVSFTLMGQPVSAINGGTHYKLTEAFSFMLKVDGQEEVDKYWGALLEGGKALYCGWLTDKFGLTWQVIPKQFDELVTAGSPQQTQAVMSAMMELVKFDVATLERAYEAAG